MKTSDRLNVKIGVMLSYVALGVSLLGSLFISNRVLNLIGDYNYGLYGFVNSITAWLTVLSSALIASYLRFSSIEAEKDEGDTSRVNTIYFKLLLYFGIIVLVIGCGSVLCLDSLQINIGDYSRDDSHLMYLLFLFSLINISITLPATIFAQYITRKKRFIFEKISTIIINVIMYAAHFLIAYCTKSILLISLYSVFQTVLTLLVNYIYCRKVLDIRFAKALLSDNADLLKKIVVFSGILVLNSIVDQINSNVDKTLLGIYSTPESITLYQMGQQFNTYLVTVSVAVSNVFAPQIHELCAREDTESVNHLFLNVSKLQSIVVCFVAFGFLSCGKDFTVWWIGEKRITSYYVASILMLVNIMPLTVKLSIEIQRAYNKHLFRSVIFAVVAGLNVILSVVFLKIFPTDKSVYACLLGTVIASLICQWIAMNIYNGKIIQLPIKEHLLHLGKCCFFGSVSLLSEYLVKSFVLNGIDDILLRFLLEGICYSVVYLSLVYVFERKFILSVLKK